MELKSVNKQEEPLFERKKIDAVLSFEKATPSYADIAKKIAEHLKTNENAVAIRKIKTFFGARSAKVTAYAYDNDASRNKIEPKQKSKAEGKKKEKVAKEAAKK